MGAERHSAWDRSARKACPYTARVIHKTRQLLWRLLAALSLALGFIGVFLPVLPTVPFVLLAAWAAGRGWPQLEAWLLAHPQFGQHIRQWRENGAVSRRAKSLAIAAMAGSAVVLWFVPVHPWLRGGVYAMLAGVAVWLALRPEPVQQAS